jgi:hypothetical protein
MGRSFIAAAGEIEISHFAGTQDTEGVQAAWGDIHMAIGSERGGGHKEERLRRDPGDHVGIDFLVNFGHK